MSKPIIFTALVLLLFACQSRMATNQVDPGKQGYTILKEWPLLAPGYQLGQPTGLGLDIKNNVSVQQLPSLAVDPHHHLFAIDYDPSLKLDSTAKGSTFFGFNAYFEPLAHLGATGAESRTTSWFHDLAVDKAGNIFVGDITGIKLLKFKPTKN
jgi:hypothetical protein